MVFYLIRNISRRPSLNRSEFNNAYNYLHKSYQNIISDLSLVDCSLIGIRPDQKGKCLSPLGSRLNPLGSVAIFTSINYGVNRVLSRDLFSAGGKRKFVIFDVFRAHIREFSIFFHEIYIVAKGLSSSCGRHQKYAYKCSS